MSVRSLFQTSLVVAFAGLAGCSGGGSGDSGSLTFGCDNPNSRVICLQNCNLGCNSTGCSRTDIAQNETLIFQFSEDIDPASVGPSSIRFRTASGAQPVGEFLTQGNQVFFVPTLAVSGGQTFFGFEAGETYTLTIPGGETQPAVVRGTSGKPFEKTLTCTMRSSLGIVDPNGVPPAGQLVLPSANQLTSAPRNTNIVLEFNELIDYTPFAGGGSGPVTFQARRNREAVGGGFECDPESDLQTIIGTTRLDFDPARDVSVVTFNPTQDLPGNICVVVTVTSGVTDLSGRPAQPQTFSFRTEVVPVTEQRITEEFTTQSAEAFFDRDSSGGSWGDDVLTFARIGGDGRHGPFSLDWCRDTETIVDGKNVFEINCDLTEIPETNTLSGSPLAVTDGQFFLTEMVVPANVRLVFIGNNPPVFTVSGRIEVLGDIVVSGSSLTTMPATVDPTGQLGAAGGPFGGRGGQGGDKNVTGGTTGVPASGFDYNGRNGGSARVRASHAYVTTTIGSGGRGSTMWPANGLNSSIQFPPVPPPPAVPPSLQAAISAVAGGGGGASWQPGGIGRVVSNNAAPPPGLLAAMGPQANGGTAVQLFPFPTGSGSDRSSLHFLMGGAGGGGAATQPTLCFSTTSLRAWAPGAGGGGGGGALALRAGDLLRIAPGAKLLARGGNAAVAPSTASSQAVPAPGGGGAGGSLVLQTGRVGEVLGSLDVRGGLKGTFSRTSSLSPNPPAGTTVVIEGGDGGHGFVRFEAPTAPTTSALATMLPPPVPENVGALTELDDAASVRSKFYSIGQQFGPQYVRYEIVAEVDGQTVTFSDDPAFGVPALQGAPIRALFQCAQLNVQTGAVIELRPWRTSVRTFQGQTGIASDGRNGFRFHLIHDRTVATNVTIQSVVVVYLL